MARSKGEGAVYFDNVRKTWVGRVELPEHDGKRRTKKVTARTRAEAAEAVRNLIRERDKRGDLPTSNMFVRDWIEYWLRNIVAPMRKPGTVTGYRSIARLYINPVIGGMRLNKVTTLHVRRVLAGMQTSSTTKKNCHSVMSGAFRAAAAEGFMGVNVAGLVDAPLTSVTDLQALTTDEARHVLSIFRESSDAYLWAAFLLTGARRGEILGLEWDRVVLDGPNPHLDLSWQLQRINWQHGCHDDAPCRNGKPVWCGARRIDVPEDYEHRRVRGGLYLTRPKSKAGWRVVPLVDPLLSILVAWRDVAPANEWGLVFTRTSTARRSARRGTPVPIRPDEATRLWPKALAECGITKPVRLHDLRHSAVDLMYEAGVPEDVIQEIVGHSTRAMSRNYKSKGNEARITDGMKKVSTLLEGPSTSAALSVKSRLALPGAQAMTRQEEMMALTARLAELAAMPAE